MIGWQEATAILPSLVPGLAMARRSEELNSWRHPVDLVALLEPEFARLPELFAAAGDDPAWRASDALTATLLGDDPAAIVTALSAALAAGAPLTAVSRAVSYAAALRVARFHTSNEFSDWITVLHTFTHANAVHQLLHRSPSPELLRGVYHAAMRLYLDRFLNTPAARLPEERPGKLAALPTDADALLVELRDLLDREQQIETAGLVVHRYLSLDHDPAPLIAETGSSAPARGRGVPFLPDARSRRGAVQRTGARGSRGGGSCPGRGGSLSGGARSDQPGHAANGEDGAPAAPR